MSKKHVLSLTNAGFHKIAYKEWGQPSAPAIMCVHGLTRNGRDFDFIASQLSKKYRVICPDLVGRGQSDWLTSDEHYQVPQYVQDITVLLARLNVKTITWLGTSLGGIIGMVIASMPKTPIRRLILNDIGPFIEKSSLQALQEDLYPGQKFKDLHELEDFLRQAYSQLGPLDDKHWRHMARFDHRRNEDGTYSRAFDPSIAGSLSSAIKGHVNLWNYWETVRCPTLILRGEHSTILSEDTCAKMLTNKPLATLVQIPNVGHPAPLVRQEEIKVVSDWLDATV